MLARSVALALAVVAGCSSRSGRRSRPPEPPLDYAMRAMDSKLTSDRRKAALLLQQMCCPHPHTRKLTAAEGWLEVPEDASACRPLQKLLFIEQQPQVIEAGARWFGERCAAQDRDRMVSDLHNVVLMKAVPWRFEPLRYFPPGFVGEGGVLNLYALGPEYPAFLWELGDRALYEVAMVALGGPLNGRTQATRILAHVVTVPGVPGTGVYTAEIEAALRAQQSSPSDGPELTQLATEALSELALNAQHSGPERVRMLVAETRRRIAAQRASTQPGAWTTEADTQRLIRVIGQRTASCGMAEVAALLGEITSAPERDEEGFFEYVQETWLAQRVMAERCPEDPPDAGR